MKDETSISPLPDADILYRALLARDQAWEGRAWVGVTTTGIFCRLTCPARKPRSENCRWFTSPEAAAQAGFRPCRRCHPTGPEASGDPLIVRLTTALADDPSRRWTEDDLVAMGLDPSTVRRAFRRHFGETFLQYVRRQRLAQGLKTISKGAAMIEAQLDAGFDSASGFRGAFARLFGHPPHQMRGGDAPLRADWIQTPLGGMIAIADQEALHLLEFTDRKALPLQLRQVSKAASGRITLGRSAVTDRTEAELTEFFAGQRPAFDLSLQPHGTAFQRRVWDRLRTIPAGQTRSYAQVAKEIGQPTATRAVAAANGRNRIAIVIPCHRVIGADGSLTGYAGGLWRKQKLIEIERLYV